MQLEDWLAQHGIILVYNIPMKIEKENVIIRFLLVGVIDGE